MAWVAGVGRAGEPELGERDESPGAAARDLRFGDATVECRGATRRVARELKCTSTGGSHSPGRTGVGGSSGSS